MALREIIHAEEAQESTALSLHRHPSPYFLGESPPPEPAVAKFALTLSATATAAILRFLRGGASEFSELSNAESCSEGIPFATSDR